jgi:Mannosyl-glycoprotein endo-beta-N-acetylglucosaminidase/D-alanyl-D-alanine carboxypeptidase
MSQSHGRLAVVVAGGAACLLTSTMAIPFLVLAAGGIDQSTGQSCDLPLADDHAPAILGPAMLTEADLTTWWSDSGRGQPAGLEVSVAELARLYLSEGEREGVRGDLAFVQAVYETGYFTSADTTINNFAGIRHPDGAGSGTAFDTARAGVRAHIQLLKRYAAGNDVELASADVAPYAAARATSWPELAGTWAADPFYWRSISSLYDQLAAGSSSQCAAPWPSTEQTHQADVEGLTTVGGITVDSSIASQVSALLEAARADGLLLSGSGYRSHQDQIDLRRAHCGSSDYAIYEMPSSRCSPPTARPGASMHERGLAIDFANCADHSTSCWQWLSRHAAIYGLFNLPSEPWHWSTTGT